MKKLSLKSLLEADVLQKNQDLKFTIVQEIPKLQQMAMKNLKTDNYSVLAQNLEQLEMAYRKAKEQLKLTLQNNSSVKIADHEV